MKVVLVSFSQLPTLQKYLHYSATELRCQGVEAFTIGSCDLKIELSDKVEGMLLEVPASPIPTIANIKRQMGEIEAAAQFILDLDPDIVHFVNKHTWNYLLLLQLKRRRCRAKIIQTFHDPIGHEGDRVQFGVKAYHRLMIKYSDAIIVHSQIAKKQVVNHFGFSKSLFEGPLGNVDWSPYVDPSPESRDLLFFGRLNHYKGCELFPNILDELYRRDDSLRLVIAGKPASNISAELMDCVRSYPNVLLLDRFIREDEISSLFAAAGVVLLPYRSVTQSGVILDAYCHSKPIVAFDVPGIEEYAYSEKCLVPPFEVSLLVDRAVEIMNDYDLRVKESQSAWRYGHDKFTPHAMTSFFVDVYRSVLGSDGLRADCSASSAVTSCFNF